MYQPGNSRYKKDISIDIALICILIPMHSSTNSQEQVKKEVARSFDIIATFTTVVYSSKKTRLPLLVLRI